MGPESRIEHGNVFISENVQAVRPHQEDWGKSFSNFRTKRAAACRRTGLLRNPVHRACCTEPLYQTRYTGRDARGSGAQAVERADSPARYNGDGGFTAESCDRPPQVNFASPSPVPAPPCLYSPKQVAEALQVSESSVKRWCDQGLISTIRTCGGHRRIPLDHLLQFLNQTERPLLNPMAIGLDAPPPRRPAPRLVAGSEEQTAFYEALQVGDDSRCRRILEEVQQRRASATQTAEHLITDAMHRIGEAWACSQLDVYQERRACNICMHLIDDLRRRFSAPTGPVAIGGSPAGDPYQLPTALVELALREAGWSAESLGANLPFDSLSRAVDAYRPRLLWVSVSAIQDSDAFTDRFNRMARRLPDDCVLLVGGRALTDEIRPRLKYTAHCDSLGQLLGLAEAMRRRAVDVPQSRN